MRCGTVGAAGCATVGGEGKPAPSVVGFIFQAVCAGVYVECVVCFTKKYELVNEKTTYTESKISIYI